MTGSGGIRLATTQHGPSEGIPLVFAHGFGQTRHAWNATGQALAALGYHSTSFDARGHGNSEWLESGDYHLEQLRDDLVSVANNAGTRPVLIGASLGGLTGLLAEAECGPLFRAMVLVDVTPRWEPQGVERIVGFMRAHPDGFANLDEAADAIATHLPHRRERKSPERLRSLLIDRGDGRLRWHWDPRLLLPIAEEGTRHQPRFLDATRTLAMRTNPPPLQLISGSASDIVSADTINEFLVLAPHASHVVVRHATHMVVGDENAVFTEHIANFLRALSAQHSAQHSAISQPRTRAVS
ncbi:MAG: alpha/beta hydrolase [Dokdonella sp.]